ncbi:MAG: ornithine--oxo-acid transaminase [Planctomycetota bacterium]|nr:ornithine--oxo-acid transaminase [Planctomycetota bacterium]
MIRTDAKTTDRAQKEIDLANAYAARNYDPLPVVLTRGEGVWVWDVDGKKFLDMLGCYSAVSQGHRHPKIIAALKEQADRLTVTSRAFHNDRLGPFLKRLCELAGMEKALPMNTGAEAVETAIKAARKWGTLKKGVPDGKAEILVCENNFHGRTTTIVGFSSEPQYRDGFGPFAPGFVTIDFGDAAQLADKIGENTVALLVEPIQGEGGVIMPPEGYLREARRICSERGILLVLDEVQTGLGRTGKLFDYLHEGIQPDLLILGKALGGGVYPVSAVLGSDEVMGVFQPGDHGSTFGGNPLAAVVGLASLDVLVEEDMAANAARLGDIFMAELRKIPGPHIQEVRGRGLFVGVEVKEESGTARRFCEALLDEGIVTKETHKQVIRFAPPLVITEDEIHWALERIQRVFTP